MTHLKHLYQTVNKVMSLTCHWINRTCRILPPWYSLYGSIQGAWKMCFPVLSQELEAMLQSAFYKFGNLTSFIRLRCKIKNINNISLKFIMLTDNNQIFRNCFIIYFHLKKVLSHLNKCIIFEPKELSIRLSNLWWNPYRGFYYCTTVSGENFLP